MTIFFATGTFQTAKQTKQTPWFYLQSIFLKQTYIPSVFSVLPLTP